MALIEHHRKNFDALRRAFRADRVALLDCRERATGRQAVCLVAMSDMDDGSIGMTPFAVMVDGNPFEMFDAPDIAGGYNDESRTGE